MLLRAYGDQHTSHLAKSLTLKNKNNQKKSKFSNSLGSEHSNLESVRSETLFSERTLNSKNVESDVSHRNYPLEYQTRERNGPMFYSDVENQPLPDNKKSPI